MDQVRDRLIEMKPNERALVRQRNITKVRGVISRMNPRNECQGGRVDPHWKTRYFKTAYFGYVDVPRSHHNGRGREEVYIIECYEGQDYRTREASTLAYRKRWDFV